MTFFKRNMKMFTLVLLLTLTLGVFTGCSSKSKDVIKVGSKDFSEQLLLGQITLLALENAGYEVEDKTNVAGSDKNRTALETGEIDLYWEYTGTAWLVHLQHDEAITDPEEAYQKVKEEDKENDMVWLEYAPLNNTYTIMMKQEKSEELGIETISDLSKYINENPDEIKFAGDHEFLVRPDGLKALEKAYEFEFGKNNLNAMEMGIVYKTLKEGDVQAGMGFATDGRIAAFNLVNLEDDKKFFPVYNACPVLRKDVLDNNPEIADVLNEIAPKLDTATMTELNYKVDIEEMEPKTVAEEWLKSEGLIE